MSRRRVTIDDTIVAIATPAGAGGIGVIRISGPSAPRLLAAITRAALPPPRRAVRRDFHDAGGTAIDSGLVLSFSAPASFTGEDVAELHTHGSRMVLELLHDALCELGARPARPGEFSERAFRNGKIDLAQAEAIASLIESRSARAARAAARSLRGEFSNAVKALVSELHAERALLEAEIDFEDDSGGGGDVCRHARSLHSLRTRLEALLGSAQQGARLTRGASIAITGAPNVGKSTLLNRLAREEKAIVSDIPGTTRDVVEVDTLIGPLPVRLSDTAGLRADGDALEREGMRRARRIAESADLVLVVTDRPPPICAAALLAELGSGLQASGPHLVVHNKMDLYDARAEMRSGDAAVLVSARTGAGLDHLEQAILTIAGVDACDENEYGARARHLTALRAALTELEQIDQAVVETMPELAAEACRRASAALEDITGEYTTEDLLGEIFARFCIGK